MDILRKKRILVTSLRPKSGGVAMPKFGGPGVTTKDLAIFTRQFATMISAGQSPAPWRQTGDLPLAELLARFGVALDMRASAGADDVGGTQRTGHGEVLALGASTRARDGALELVNVLDGGAAQRAGLNPGDVLVALDRLRVNERNLRRRLARFETGERVTATVFRGDELLEVGLVLKPAPLDTCCLVVQEKVDADTVRRREAWLGQVVAP